MSQNTFIKSVTNQFKGFTICVTGLFDKFSSKGEFESYFEKRGGITVDFPDKTCKFLVCGKFTDSYIQPEKTARYIKAKELSVKIISEYDFFDWTRNMQP